jgi:arginine/ornithine N-succinyltransferase beta subunit
VLVEVTGAVFEVEHRARLVVGELFEEDGSLVVFVENAGVQITGKPWVKASDGFNDPFTNSRCTLGVGLCKSFETFAEPRCVFVSDREDADAALGTAGFTDEMMATARGGRGERCIYDLNERGHENEV